MLSLDNIYKQLDEQQDVLVKHLNASNPVPPNLLSDVGMKLSILNGLLGSRLASLKANQINAERKAYDKAIKDGKSATAANSIARFESAQERADFEFAETKHKDMWKLISMAQSHIRAEGDQQKGLS